MAFAMKAIESQKALKAPLSSTLADISHLEVAAPYSPNTATAITPTQQDDFVPNLFRGLCVTGAAAYLMQFKAHKSVVRC